MPSNDFTRDRPSNTGKRQDDPGEGEQNAQAGTCKAIRDVRLAHESYETNKCHGSSESRKERKDCACKRPIEHDNEYPTGLDRDWIGPIDSHPRQLDGQQTQRASKNVEEHASSLIVSAQVVSLKIVVSLLLRPPSDQDREYCRWQENEQDDG